MIDQEEARSALAWLRIGVGAGGWLAPRLSGKLFGLEPDENPVTPYVARLFAARDFAMGVALLDAEEPERDRWLRIGIAVDAADGVAALLAGARGYLSKRAAVMTAGTAFAAVWLGAQARRR